MTEKFTTLSQNLIAEIGFHERRRMHAGKIARMVAEYLDKEVQAGEWDPVFNVVQSVVTKSINHLKPAKVEK